MKRSSFLKSLLALPFLPKLLSAEEPFIGQKVDGGYVTAINYTTGRVDVTPFEEIPQLSRSYSPTSIKELDRIWRECSRKLLEGMEKPTGW